MKSKPKDTDCGVPRKPVAAYPLRMGRCVKTTGKKPRWADNARRLMKQKKITQEDLVNPLGVKTRGAVGHYFQGRRKLSLAQAEAMAERLGVTVSQMLGEAPLAADPEKSAAISALLDEISEEQLPVVEALLRALAHPPEKP